MHRSASLVALALAVALPPLTAAAQPAQPAPTGLTLTASMGGGGELGLDHGKAGVLEVEAAAGYELASMGLRGELGLALGLDPDTHVAFRPGVRWSLPQLPLQLRAALDAATSRESGLHWRWLLVGVAAELRLTGLLGLYAEADTGAPLASEHGVPLLVRAGASFRF